MMARKKMGLTAIIMLGLLSVLLYLTNKSLWAPVKARAKQG
jgi:ubiquinol-cytochrome c reductase cytochrome c1 subunit